MHCTLTLCREYNGRKSVKPVGKALPQMHARQVSCLRRKTNNEGNDE